MKITGRFLALTITAVLALTGCRFGNYTEKEKGSNVTALMLGTQPVNLLTAVLYNDTSENGNQNMDFNENTTLSAVPGYVSGTFTNPVEFLYINEFKNSYTEAGFRSLDASYSIGAKYMRDGTIQGGIVSTISILWSNEGCLTQEQISHDGTIDKTKKDVFTDLDGKTKKTDGRLKNSLYYQRVFSSETPGACLADLKFLAGCYQNPSSAGCSQSAVQFAVDLFHMYVYYGGILNLDDATLARIQSLAYILDFE